ncbi:MAG: HAD family hydrolase [Magnetococcales bacterium]|nr:HAD family hydrolase [Magnetococcales bacterium]MBF0322097.1 HAD family hydrolase [Magnetococcales bacterium]
MFHIFFFDFDGVLADSVPVKDAALAHLFRAHDVAVQERAMAVWNRHKGVFRPERIRRVFREALGVVLDDRAVAAQVALFVEQGVERTVSAPPIAGSLAFLERYAAQYPCYVVSTGPQSEVREIVTRRGIAHHFRGIFGGPETKPVILSRILAQEGCSPDAALFLGDSITDFTSAQAVNMPFLGVVAPGLSNPFPVDIAVVPDLTTLTPNGSA